MLFKFTSPDMFNTSLIDVATGKRAYDILTLPLPPVNLVEKPASMPLTSESCPMASSSSSSSASPPCERKRPSESQDKPNNERRQTTITDATGKIVSNIIWNGRRPDITIHDEKVGALTDLFGSTTVRFLPKVLSIPTRFDTEYIWTATPDSLTLFDYDTDTIKGTFHQNVFRMPTRSQKSSRKLSLTSADPLNSTTSFSTSSTDESEQDKDTLKPTFISTHIPGVGSNYLEFSSHPLAVDIEIILSFLMMEILRRGRFNLTPYMFDKPKLWQFKEARDQFMRRLRRNTF